MELTKTLGSAQRAPSVTYINAACGNASTRMAPEADHTKASTYPGQSNIIGLSLGNNAIS